MFFPETKYLYGFNGDLHLKMPSPLKILNQYFQKNYFSFGEPRHYSDDYTDSQVTEPSLALLLFLFPCISITAHIHTALCNRFLVIVLTRSQWGKRVTRINISVLPKGEPQTWMEDNWLPPPFLQWSYWDTHLLPQFGPTFTLPSSRCQLFL